MITTSGQSLTDLPAPAPIPLHLLLNEISTALQAQEVKPASLGVDVWTTSAQSTWHGNALPPCGAISQVVYSPGYHPWDLAAGIPAAQPLANARPSWPSFAAKLAEVETSDLALVGITQGVASHLELHLI